MLMPCVVRVRVGVGVCSGAGGFLQVPLLAYPGIYLNDTAMTLKPALFEGASRVVIRGYAYRGSRLRIEYDAASVTLQVVTADASMPPIVSATRHTYAPLCACDTTHTTGSLLPATPLAARSQRGQVVVDGYRVTAPALVVVDASGRVFPLGTAPVSLPVGQQLVITTAA
ncbi:hypothetical protein EON67_02585 [archaeon]|nr:MAG: hypothetical protein EON67_02585 [archaeon]